MATPTTLAPDGVYREKVAFSTTVSSRFITGIVPEDAADVQVSINGSGWSSDLLWGDGKWTVPNPTLEPEGLILLQGSNIVRVRAILPSGQVTPETSSTIYLVTDAGVVASVPTTVTVEQKNSSVIIYGETSSTEGFQGLNVYASVYAGGGLTGYQKVNVNPVSTGVSYQSVQSFASFESESSASSVDPLYFRLVGKQEYQNGTVIQEDFNQVFEVPEATSVLRITSELQSVQTKTRYAFNHNRSASTLSTPPTIGIGEFAALPNTEPLYYVLTAVYWDATQSLEFESSYSVEVVGHPVAITTSLVSIPTASKDDVVGSYVGSLYRSNPQVKFEPGSVLRDTVIDPFSSESERLRFVFDFFQRARTPSLLLQIDDPNLTGVSVPVAQSPYKKALQAALYIGSVAQVQTLIDSSFDAFASNYGLSRKGGIAARGEVLFFTRKRPTQSIIIPIGTVVSGGGYTYVTTVASAILFDRLASYYDPTTGRYQVRVAVRATATGSGGNVGAGQVKTLVSSLTGSVSVVNPSAMFGGKAQESNLELTVRVQNALASVDSGTARGYLQTAAGVAGVVKANVIAAGAPLMLRDLEDGVHRGGKVDVWVQGSNVSTVTDTFAFTFDVAQNIQFLVQGDPSELSFMAYDPLLSTTNPIIQMLNDSNAGFEFINATTGEVFDLTGVTITSYNTISLSSAVTQPSVTLTDVVLGSYRRRAGNTFTMTRQPVSSLISLTGSVSGSVTATLTHPDSPLGYGRSIEAEDYLSVTPYTDSAGNPVPSEDTIIVTGETHVLIGSYSEYLNSLGVNYLSLKVYNSDRSVLYRGPNDPSGLPDYTVNLGTQTKAISIQRVESGRINSGDTLSIDYEHDENFTVSYTTNLIVSITQEEVDIKKHTTADVLVKEAVPIPLSLSATVVYIRGRDRVVVDTALRTNLQNFFQNLRLGDPVRQSDIIQIIERTQGVSYVLVPLAKMAPSDGAQIVRESISTDIATESVLLTAYTTSKALVYLLTNPLQYATVNGGALSEGDFRGVFQNDVALNLLAGDAPVANLGVLSGRAYIIGNEGLTFPGYSDDATLTAAGYVTPTAIAARRLELTANRVLVSLSEGAPTAYQYTATYTVAGCKGALDVDPGEAQYVTQGELLITYDEDQ